MELEKWLEKHDIEKMVMKNLEYYLSEYKKEDEEEFNKLFENMDLDKVRYEFHSVSYVINKRYLSGDDARKYISAKVRLEYDETPFAEYEAIYGLDGEGEDDYLRKL